MASKAMHPSCKTIYLSCCIILFLIIGSCTATRPGSTMFVEEKPSQLGSETMKTHRGMLETSFQYKGQMFNFFPKGVPVPPSGPSKRHNSVADSTPSD